MPEGATNIWPFYPPGWRRDAYCIYEEHTVQGTENTLLSLLANLHIPGFLRQFRQLVPSEEKSEFSIFYLKVEHSQSEAEMRGWTTPSPAFLFCCAKEIHRTTALPRSVYTYDSDTDWLLRETWHAATSSNVFDLVR